MSYETHADTQHTNMEADTAPHTIDIHFEGLFFFCFDRFSSPTKCRIGAVTLAPDHELSILISKTLPDGTTAPLVERVFNKHDPPHTDPDDARHYKHLDIRASGEYTPMTLCGGGTRIMRDYKSGDDENFGWVIDFENDELYNRKVFRNKGIFRPVITINAGEFYTARIAKHFYDCVRLVPGMEKPRPFGYVAKTIGVRINLGATGKVSMDIGRRTPLILPDPPGSTYKICFDNRCLDCKKDDPHACFGLKCEDIEQGELVSRSQALSDLHYYYPAFNLLPTEWYDLVPRPPLTKAVDPYICYGSVGSRTNDIDE